VLIEHGADPIGEGDYHELEVIGWATCFGSGQKDIVDYLVAHGAEHNIFSAAAMGETGVIKSLAARSRGDLERRMDLANRRRRPLHLAVVKKQPAALQTLLELGAKTESLDEAGFTALDQAAMSGETEMADLLIDRGAKIRMPAAVALQRMDDVERLLREDPGCLKPGTSGYTPLHAAGFFGNADAAVVLLTHGANVNARDERYCGTPAGWANYAGHTRVRDLIVDGPIDIFEAIDRNVAERLPGILERDPESLSRPFGQYFVGQSRPGQWWPESWCTPLAWAVIANKADALRILLEHGADATITSPDGRTLDEMAAQAGRQQVAEVLEEYRGDSRR
jgi:ankyrin repeat protein